MAKKIEELIVELGIKGLDGLENLSSSFRNLQKAIGPSDQAITKVRKSILDMSSAGKQSIQMIQGQIDAFKGLQTQATIGSNVYKQLAGDVNRLSDTLKKLKGDYEEVGRVAKQTDAQIANQFPATRPNAFRAQLAALNRQLEKIGVSARAYGDALTEITRRELAFGRAQARQQVIAGAQAVGDPLIARMTPRQDLPNTLAALQLRISELTQDFDNLDRAGEQYAPTLAEINRLQRELTRATEDGNADRKAEIKERIDNYRAIQAENAALRERRQIAGSIRRNRERTAGPPLIEQPMREISGLFQQIGQIGMQPIISNIEMMGNSYDEVAASIRAATAASNGSISSLQAQRGAWQQLRAQLDPASFGFRDAGREIEQLNDRIERLQRTRRRMSAMEATQAAGAVISGGIFGGPEGFLGGLGGLAAGLAIPGLGAVGGAFAGAAIGAQVGMFRQQLGFTAELSADLEKQRTALRLVLKDTGEYNQALTFLNQVSKDYAIPQDQLIKGFTQLAASVVGAGGNIKDTKIAFEGITAGVRGTGRSLQDLDAALRATSQVFSKGKVSAEELRGQIGERLPGAFTLFAQAIGKTPQELDKALERGEVTLQDFLSFSKTLFGEYGENAKVIADSPAAAGDRLQTSLKNLSETVGKLLAPVGASFQSTFADIVKYIDEATKKLADFLGLNQSNAERMGQLNNLIIIQQRAIARERTKVEEGITSKEAADYAIRQFEARIVQFRAELNTLKALERATADQAKERSGLSGGGAGQSQADAEKARKEAEKARKDRFNQLLEQLNAQNQVLEQQGRLNESIAKTEILKAAVAKSAANEALLNEQKQLDLRLQYGEISRSVYDAEVKAIRLQTQIVEIEFRKTVDELTAQAKRLVDSVFGPSEIAGPTLTPLQQIEEKIRKDIEAKIKEASKIGGVPGEAAAARLRTANVNQLATKELLSGEFTSLEQQIQDLKDAGRELSTLDILKRKYLADWNTLDPVLRNQLELMAAQVDALKNQQKAIEGLRNVAGAIGDAFGNSFKSVITGAATAKEALASFFSSVADSFADMAAKMIAEWIKLAIFNSIVRIFNPAPGLSDLNAPASINNPLGVLNANGNAFAANGIVPYAKGGIVNRPTMFKFARGGTMQTGLMGEAGPEAIMPLKRGPDGKLGVQATGGGGITVNVSVDANGTQVQGDPGQGQQLGRVIAGAVQAELIKQQRPGGLLSKPR